MDLPPPFTDHTETVIESLQAAAETAAAGLPEIISGLPEPLQPAAERAVVDSTEHVEQVLQEHLPDYAVDSDTDIMDSVTHQARPELAPTPPVTRPSPFVPDTGVSPGAGSSGVVVSPIPAILPGTSLAPIGAIAVFAPWLRKAGQICDGITAPVLAALYSVENGFRYGPGAPVSPVGAKGPGQFMPGTWDAYGKDADGDGKADVLGVADPVMASGHLLCDNYAQIEQWKHRGLVVGDTLDLTLASYNAGLGAVRRSGGMPSGLPDYENQTKPYVAKIRATEPWFARLLSPMLGLERSLGSSDADDIGNRIVELALEHLGLPYIWGGGNIHGPSGGGFDCSGLTSYAVHAATGITLPRTSQTQWQVGTGISMSEARVGDLVFGNWQVDGPGHVGIYLGAGQMIHAPTFGDVVRVAPVFPDMKVRRII
ncbi:NlpC/P60 family protein [Rhodococcus rhodochrous]|uniref:NlpC/P60 family protein n=1 Tax=Rhodococcus rhodochrous TaxID=1829 RepID=A0AAW4XN81_RHORH|nr:NlpC/P60 family protein [Rhodococcus rhodochrous]MCD2114739.1 NlpC/P60 family protein [Rhodococcus rhodochrous]